MKHIPDFAMIAGAALISYGAWLVYLPAGFIVGGLLALLAGIRMAGVAK